MIQNRLRLFSTRDRMQRFFTPLKILDNLVPPKVKGGPPLPADPIMNYEIEEGNDPLDTWFYHFDSPS
jgi:hypothetical protein